MDTIDPALQALREDLSGKNDVADSLLSVVLASNMLKSMKEAVMNNEQVSQKVSPHQNSFKKISFILRRRMIPLYQASLKTALQFAAAVLAATTGVKDLGDTEFKAFLEDTQEALLAGILDFLEQHNSTDNQALAASIFYYPLCQEFFPRGHKHVIYARDNLLCAAFQLLSETVISHPVNQHKLRDPTVLGGKRLGFMLAQCRDFLVIEALLELFGNIIPSAKTPEKRARFIGDVFSPSQFKCSSEVSALLENILPTGWDRALSNIYDVLATANIEYPQPFETAEIRIGKESYPVCRVYVDKNAFTASVDEGGRLETLKVPFHTVHQIGVSTRSPFVVTATVDVAAPPFLGHAPVTNESGKVSVNFDLEKGRLRHLTIVLQQRGLKNIIATPRKKQSMAESRVDLASRSMNRETAPVMHKIENLSKLWRSQESPNEIDQEVNTSPLHNTPKTGLKDEGPDNLGVQHDRTRTFERVAPMQCMKNLTHGCAIGSSSEEASAIGIVEPNVFLDHEVKTKEQFVAPLCASKRSPNLQHKARTRRITTGKSRSVSPDRSSEARSIALRTKHKFGGRRYAIRTRVLSAKSDAEHDGLKAPESDAVSWSVPTVPPGGVSAIDRLETCVRSPGVNKSVAGDERLTIEATALPAKEEEPMLSDNKARKKHGCGSLNTVKFQIKSPLPSCGMSSVAPVVTNCRPENNLVRHTTKGTTFGTDNEATIGHEKGRSSHKSDFLLMSRATLPALIDLTEDGPEKVISAHLLFEAASVLNAKIVGEGSMLPEAAQPTYYAEAEVHLPATQKPLTYEYLEGVRAGQCKKTRTSEVQPSEEIRMKTERCPPVIVALRQESKANGYGYFDAVPNLPELPQEFSYIAENWQPYRGRCAVSKSISSQQQKSDDKTLVKIIDIVDQIHEMLTKAAAKKFKDMRVNIQLSPASILKGTTSDSVAVRGKSMQHHEQLVDLANEYATHQLSVVHALEQLLAAEVDVVKGVRNIMKHHDRLCLSSQFPADLSPDIPECFNVGS